MLPYSSILASERLGIPPPHIQRKRKIRKKPSAKQLLRNRKNNLTQNNSIVPGDALTNNVNIQKIKTKLRKLAYQKQSMHIKALNGEINNLIKEAFEKMGGVHLAEKVQWRWNRKLTSTMGLAYYVWIGHFAIPTHIEFSPSLFYKATPKQRKQTVYHEVAHCMDYYSGNYDPHAPHGPSWRSYMIMSGLPPDRCHTVKIEKKSKATKYKAICSCETGVIISKICLNRIKRGAKYICNKCRQNISLEGIR